MYGSEGEHQAYGQCGPLTDLCRVSLQGMYEYGVEYGIIQDGEIPDVRLRGNGLDRPSYPHNMPLQFMSGC